MTGFSRLPTNIRGFTLVELLVVIAIISALSSMTLASLNQARAKARDAVRISDLRQTANLLELYYNDYGYYPSHFHIGGTYSVASTNYSGNPNIGWATVTTGLNDQLAAYSGGALSKDPLNKCLSVPTNRFPQNSDCYGYYYGTPFSVLNPSVYELATRLETDHSLACSNANNGSGYIALFSHAIVGGPNDGANWCDPGGTFKDYFYVVAPQ